MSIWGRVARVVAGALVRELLSSRSGVQPPSSGPVRRRKIGIEYRDALGRVTMRQIEVSSIRTGFDGVPVVTGKCKLRQAYRRFRLDRVEAVIDGDGVLHQPTRDLWRQTLGVDWTPTKH